MRLLRTAALLAATVGALVPASAQARVKPVSMGLPPKAQATFNEKYLADVNDFFPHRVTVNVGDGVDFVPNGFHAIEIPAAGARPASWVAATGSRVAGATDSAGSPFWFDGAAAQGYLGALSTTLYGRRAVYDGSTAVRTGLPDGPRLKPARVRFAHEGRFRYWCNLHAGMTGVVDVRPRGRSVHTARRDARTVRRQIARDLTIAKGLPKIPLTAGTVDVGVAGARGVEWFGMHPARVTVPVGTTLRFRKSPGSYEDHTATFGPGLPGAKPQSYVGRLSASFQSPVFDPRAYYPSEPAGSVATLTPALHGNGFWNSGLMDSGPATPMPDSASVTFGAAGTYSYFCLLHTFMRGTVVVR